MPVPAMKEITGAFFSASEDLRKEAEENARQEQIRGEELKKQQSADIEAARKVLDAQLNAALYSETELAADEERAQIEQANKDTQRQLGTAFQKMVRLEDARQNNVFAEIFGGHARARAQENVDLLQKRITDYTLILQHMELQNRIRAPKSIEKAQANAEFQKHVSDVQAKGAIAEAASTQTKLEAKKTALGTRAGELEVLKTEAQTIAAQRNAATEAVQLENEKVQLAIHKLQLERGKKEDAETELMRAEVRGALRKFYPQLEKETDIALDTLIADKSNGTLVQTAYKAAKRLPLITPTLIKAAQQKPDGPEAGVLIEVERLLPSLTSRYALGSVAMDMYEGIVAANSKQVPPDSSRMWDVTYTEGNAPVYSMMLDGVQTSFGEAAVKLQENTLATLANGTPKKHPTTGAVVGNTSESYNLVFNSPSFLARSKINPRLAAVKASIDSGVIPPSATLSINYLIDTLSMPLPDAFAFAQMVSEITSSNMGVDLVYGATPPPAMVAATLTDFRLGGFGGLKKVKRSFTTFAEFQAAYTASAQVKTTMQNLQKMRKYE